MKKLLLATVILFASMNAFGSAEAQNVDFGFYGFSFVTSSETASNWMAGVSYRYIYYPKDVGFYFGGDLTVAFPTYASASSDGYVYGFRPFYTNVTYLMMPLGYRWSGKDIGMGFFLGGGPSFQFLASPDLQDLVGLGITGEFGYETNLTEGSAFHFTFQFGWSPGVFGTSSGYLSGNGFNSGLRFGITWRRIKDDQTKAQEAGSTD